MEEKAGESFFKAAIQRRHKCHRGQQGSTGTGETTPQPKDQTPHECPYTTTHRSRGVPLQSSDPCLCIRCQPLWIKATLNAQNVNEQTERMDD